jgi:hypothetical protein
MESTSLMDLTDSLYSAGINRLLGSRTEIKRLTGLDTLLRTQKIFGFGFIPLGRTYYSYENTTYQNFDKFDAHFLPAVGDACKFKPFILSSGESENAWLDKLTVY